MSDDKINRIRKRATYRVWKEILEFLNTNPSKEAIMRKIYSILDNYRAFGSTQHSIWALESLEQVIRDDMQIFLDMLYSDIEEIMKEYGFSQISEQHDNGSMVLHFYNEERDILFIIEEQQMPDKELLGEYGINILEVKK